MNGLIPTTPEEWEELKRLQNQPYDSDKAFEDGIKAWGYNLEGDKIVKIDDKDDIDKHPDVTRNSD